MIRQPGLLASGDECPSLEILEPTIPSESYQTKVPSQTIIAKRKFPSEVSQATVPNDELY